MLGLFIIIMIIIVLGVAGMIYELLFTVDDGDDDAYYWSAR